jgi:hypothetical protein
VPSRTERLTVRLGEWASLLAGERDTVVADEFADARSRALIAAVCHPAIDGRRTVYLSRGATPR